MCHKLEWTFGSTVSKCLMTVINCSADYRDCGTELVVGDSVQAHILGSVREENVTEIKTSCFKTCGTP